MLLFLYNLSNLLDGGATHQNGNHRMGAIGERVTDGKFKWDILSLSLRYLFDIQVKECIKKLDVWVWREPIF